MSLKGETCHLPVRDQEDDALLVLEALSERWEEVDPIPDTMELLSKVVFRQLNQALLIQAIIVQFMTKPPLVSNSCVYFSTSLH